GIAGIGVTHHSGRRIVPEYATDALLRGLAPVADDHDARVWGEPHADTAAVVERYPGGAARGVEKRIQHGPVRDGIRAVAHALGLAVGARHRAAIEMIAADDDRSRQLAGSDHVVERHAQPIALPETHPADACRQAL